MREFITIAESVQSEITEKKSKFIASLFYVENSEEAEKIIKEIKRKYFDARHNCIAYRVIENGNVIEKSSDDGEPSGTAGAPMLDILQKNNLANVLIIVTRYFGGILLGTGGLVRAYSASLLQAIDKCSIIKKCFGEALEIELEYSELENFKYYCNKNNINIIDVKYSDLATCLIEANFVEKENITSNTNLSIQKYKIIRKKHIRKNVEK